MNVENEEVFDSDNELGSAGEEDETAGLLDLGENYDEDNDEVGIHDTPTRRGRHSARPLSTMSPGRASAAALGVSDPILFGSPRRPSGPSRRPRSPLAQRASLGRGMPMMGPGSPNYSRRPSGNVPSIFAHPGVRTPPAVLDAQRLLAQADDGNTDALGDILEHRGALSGVAQMKQRNHHHYTASSPF